MINKRFFAVVTAVLLVSALLFSACAQADFLKGETPESLWLESSDFDSKVKQENSETLDIFEPGMDNLFDAGQIVIDAALAGELG